MPKILVFISFLIGVLFILIGGLLYSFAIKKNNQPQPQINTVQETNNQEEKKEEINNNLEPVNQEKKEEINNNQEEKKEEIKKEETKQEEKKEPEKEVEEEKTRGVFFYIIFVFIIIESIIDIIFAIFSFLLLASGDYIRGGVLVILSLIFTIGTPIVSFRSKSALFSFFAGLINFLYIAIMGLFLKSITANQQNIQIQNI